MAKKLAPAETAERAYDLGAYVLCRKPEKTAAAALKKHHKELEEVIGERYAPAVPLIVDAFYNMDNYAPDGVPMDELYRMINDEAN